jgi:hypothetical protein
MAQPRLKLTKAEEAKLAEEERIEETKKIWEYCTISVISPGLVTRDASGGMPISPELGMARDRSEISPKF